MIPNHGNQTQKIPPKTSVSERRVKSVAGKSFDFIENKISPEQTKNPCNAESEEFFKEINIKENFELADQFYDIHVFSNYLIISLIAIHILAVIFHKIFFKENLIKKIL